MAISPQFAVTPRIGDVNFAAANTNLDGTGTLNIVITAAGSLGTKINKVIFKYVTTNTVGMIRLFEFNGSAGRLIKEFPTTANTPSATNPSFTVEWNCEEENIFLPVGYSLRATTQVAESINVVAFGADL